MKKLFVLVALLVCPILALTGCGGGGEPKVVEASSPDDGSGMTPDQQKQYEEQMKSGMSSRSSSN